MDLQEWFNRTARPEFVAELLTVEDACAKAGWAFADKPICCGKEVERS